MIDTDWYEKTGDWQAILTHNRQAPFQQKQYDLCRYWRAVAFRAHQGQAEPLVRALAFKSVLDHLAIEADGGWLYGHCRGFTSDVLPAGVAEGEMQRLSEEHEAKGQRDFWAGFDHTLADYPTLLSIGMDGYRKRVQASLARHPEPGAQVFLQAVDLTLEAFSDFIRRMAGIARQVGDVDGAATCAAIAAGPPRHFWEALQLVWLTHLAFKSEGRCHMALGRIDQVLWPFYERDLREGRLTREGALEWLCHLWARLDEIGEVQNICIGGLTPDGRDATNELSYLCLEATGRVNSPHTNLSARFHDHTPDAFHRACFELIRSGIGFPAIFNDHVLIEGLCEIGIPIEVARDYCMVGCIETMLPGRQPPWSDSRFNTPLYLLQAMEAMAGDTAPRCGATPSYERLVALFRRELAQGIAAHAGRVNAHLARFPAGQFPDPFLSALTRDCIERGLDVNDGGAAFPRFHGICIMGLATIADSLAAVKKLVFEEKRVAYRDLVAALRDDFAGAQWLRQMLEHKAPKYGNDDPYVDEIAAQVVAWRRQRVSSSGCWGVGGSSRPWLPTCKTSPPGGRSGPRRMGATPSRRFRMPPARILAAI